MKRREFLQAGLGAAALATLHTRAYAAAQDTPLRVGLIGTGWYGKTDLFHLIQMAQVDVVGLCDVDAHMVAEAAELVAGRQPSGKKPPTYGDYRKLLSDQKPQIVLIGTPDHWHCLPMVEACRQGVTCTCRSRSAGMWSKARPWWRQQESTIGRSKWDYNAAARLTFWRRATGSFARASWARSLTSTCTATTAARLISRPPPLPRLLGLGNLGRTSSVARLQPWNTSATLACRPRIQ